jgi:hypothetical protein
MALTPRRFTQSPLQPGFGGDTCGVLAGFLSPTDLGAPFNGGNVTNGQTIDTPVLWVSGYNNFMLIETHAGAAVNWRVETLEPFTQASLFDDLIGAGPIGTNRLNWGASSGGVRTGDPWIAIQVRITNTSGVTATGVTLRLWFSNRS